MTKTRKRKTKPEQKQVNKYHPEYILIIPAVLGPLHLHQDP